MLRLRLSRAACLSPSLATVTALAGLMLTAGCGDDAVDTTSGDTDPPGTSGTSATGTSPTTTTTSPTTTSPTTTVDATTGEATDATGSDTSSETGTTATTDPTATDPTATESASEPGTSTGMVTASESDTDTTVGSTTDASSTGDGPCTQGTIVCEGDVAKVCDGLGGFESEETCPSVCAPGLGCTECVPNAGQCDGPIAQKCNEEGSGFVETLCDDVQGVTCDANAGECVGACAPNTLGNSYIGCQYYPTVTPNVVGENFSFAVVVSNVSNADADVTITRGGAPVVDIVVPANTVEVIPLPWVALLKQTGASRTLADGAYRLRSTQPVTVYQYSPLQYQMGNQFSYTNDASLLMPTNVWGTETVVVSRNTLNGLPGLYAVVAREDNTKVTLMPSATGKIIQAGGGVAADGTGVVTLGEGDVLQVLSAAGGGEPNTPDISDVTGTRVLTDKPVQVIAAHACSYIPFNITACDHLEEFNLPLVNLAKEYLVSTPLVKPPNLPVQIKARRVRVIATTDGTTLTYDPPQNGAPAMLAKAGDYAEIQTDKDFQITGNFKIAVSEYMLGQEAGGNTGDPAMTISVPTEQYRSFYSFHAPTNYESSFVNVTAPDGANVKIDGVVVPGFVAIGASGFSIARVQLSNAGDGDHTITGDKPFGVQVYGYGQYTSYWYPGGLNLNLIPQ